MKNNLLNNGISELADFIIEKVFDTLNCIKIGKVIKFYTEDKTADIEIINKVNINGELKNIALLLKCLVMGNKITTPIEEGENVIVLFNDYDLNAYFETGEAQEPYSSRKHDLSDGIVLCGLNNLINKINYDNENITLNYISNIKVGETIQLNGNTQVSNDLNVNNNIVCNNNIDGATFSTGGQVGVSGVFVDTPSGKSITITNGIITAIN